MTWIRYFESLGLPSSPSISTDFTTSSLHLNLPDVLLDGVCSRWLPRANQLRAERRPRYRCCSKSDCFGSGKDTNRASLTPPRDQDRVILFIFIIFLSFFSVTMHDCTRLADKKIMATFTKYFVLNLTRSRIPIDTHRYSVPGLSTSSTSNINHASTIW